MGRDEFLVESSIGMPRGSLLRIEDGRDLVVYVLEGALWLTQQGDARDRVVAARDGFRLERNGLTLAHAMRRTVVTLGAPTPELYARRIMLARAGSGMPMELYSAASDPTPLGARLRRLWARLFAPHARPTIAAL